jgi:hypothetical protein
METKNLDIYGDDPIPWSRALEQLEGFQGGPGQSTWIATSDPNGTAHLAGVGAIWLDGRFWFTSGPKTRKSRNIAANASCAISVSLKDLDLVVEGRANRVTDEATLDRLAETYRKGGWEPTVQDGAFTAAFSAPSAGPPPWYVYELIATKAFGVATAEPNGASRWTF